MRTNTSASSPTQGNHPPRPPLRLATREPAGPPPSVVPRARFSPGQLASLHAEYRRIKADRLRWRLLSLLLGGAGLLLILFVIPHDDSRPFDEKMGGLVILAMFLLGLGLMYSGKFKGRGSWWGFAALTRVGLIRRATQPDLLKARLEELKHTLEAHGERV